jgi:hypothetical protein
MNTQFVVGKVESLIWDLDVIGEITLKFMKVWTGLAQD